MDRTNKQGGSVDGHLPVTTRHRNVSVVSSRRAPVRPRWGEDQLYTQNRNDNLTCLRNNFDSCHEIRMDQRTMAKEPYRHMIPKPMSIDIVHMSRKGNRNARRYSTERVSNCQVFPILDAYRKTKEDQYVLSEKTRSAIEQINNKRYCVTSHATMFGDIDGESNILSPITYHRGKQGFGFIQKAENYNLPEIKHTNINHASDNEKTPEQHTGYSDSSIGTAGDVSRNILKSKENRNNAKFATSSEYVQLHPRSLIGAETLQMAPRPDEMCKEKGAFDQEEKYRHLLNNGWNRALSMKSNFEKEINVNQMEDKNTSRQNKLDFKCNSVHSTHNNGNLYVNSDKIVNRNYSSGEDGRLPKLNERNCGSVCNGPILKCNICQQICCKDERGGLRCPKCHLQESNHALTHLNCLNQKSFSGTDFIPGTYPKVSLSTNSYSCNDDNNSLFSTQGQGPGYNRGYSSDSTYTVDNVDHCRYQHLDQSDEGIKLYGYHRNKKHHECTVLAHSSKAVMDSSKAIKCDNRHERPCSGVAALSKVHDSNTICSWSDNINAIPTDNDKINISKKVQTVPKKTVCFSHDLVNGKPKRIDTKDSIDKMPSQRGDFEVEDTVELPNYRPRILAPPFSKTEAHTRYRMPYNLHRLRISHNYFLT
ncbi:hypothetical protein CHS0354_016787 [Potamilus streckersoni]|uniref:Uncharacterized protein n=1 Tax=Potamilus streckersoni TaxID=2493646 RepID=A0AAE0T3C9_9BIVA|nr:hypothetical protein CHS0354_016787 [Potamilus streckersoni]